MGPVARHGDLIDCSDRQRLTLVTAVIDRFAAAFPDLAFTLDWRADNLNACATVERGRRGVALWGGLARHRLLGENGLAVALAHEVGHHLGGRPFDPVYPWLSCEAQADYWATRVGMKRVFGDGDGAARALGGAGEIVALYRSFWRPAPRWSSRERGQPRRVLSPRCRWLTLRAGALGRRKPACTCSRP